MTREIFPEVKAGDKLGATHVNALSQAVRNVTGMGGGSNVSSHGGQGATPPPFLQRVFRVFSVKYEPSDADDESSESSHSSSSVSSASPSITIPTENRRYYEIEPMYYDFSTSSWKVNEDEYLFDLDSSAFPGAFEVGDIIVAWWDPQRSAFISVPVVTSTTSEGGEGETPSGGGGCCCDESNCIHVPGVDDSELVPTFLYFFPSNFNCGCTGGENTSDGAVRLYKQDGGTWESPRGSAVKAGDDPLMCPYPDCTRVGNFTWDGENWIRSAGDVPGCCESPVPDYSGTVVGQTASTSCTPSTLESYWILDGTSLNFVIGGQTVASYILDSPRGFCITCTNTFRLITCNKILCRGGPPSTICLIASLGGQTLVCELAGWEVELPAALVGTLTGYNCACSENVTTALGLVDEALLPDGVAARWESGLFGWYKSGECLDQLAGGFYPWVYLLKLRVTITGGFGVCYSAETQLLAQLSVFCVDDSIDYRVVASENHSISTVEDLTEFFATTFLDKVTVLCPGISGGLVSTFPMCGYLLTPSGSWAPGTSHDMALYPDHYVTVIVAAPPEI